MSDPEPRSAAALIDLADRHYQARDWSAALRHYRDVLALDPGVASEQGVPLLVAHCLIELDGGVAPDGGGVPPSADLPRYRALITDLRCRLLELSYAGDFARAVALLGTLAPVDRSIRYARETVTGGPSPCLALLDAIPEPKDPPFVAALRVDARDVPAIKARHAGDRLLLVFQRYADDPERRHDLVDNIALAAREFGLSVRELNSHVLRPGSTCEDFAGELLQEILAFRPHVILYDDLFHLGISAANPAVVEAVGSVLEQARTQLGVRVVRTLPDGWSTALQGDDHLFLGLGQSVDLLHHCHPAILDRGTPAQQAATWCYTYPTSIEPASVARGGIPRACFVGGVHYASMARAVWWIEAARQNLPIDFVITLRWQREHLVRPMITDVEYSNLLAGHQFSINLTQRFSGVRILTGRTMEIMLAGGVLLEEDSVDTAYFFQPGVHYMPFQTLADLRHLIDRLLADPARCRALAEAGRQWTARYCGGDYFWAEMYARLDRL